MYASRILAGFELGSSWIRAGFELVSNRVRDVFETYSRHIQIPFKDMSSDISFDTVFDSCRIRLEPDSKRSNAME